MHSGEFIGAYRHVGADDQETLRIELISDEALKTSEIEGEILNRDSVQSSLRHQLGLGTEPPSVPPAERGIAEDDGRSLPGLRRALSDQTMFAWHKMVMSGDREIDVIGGYRTHADAMQVVSGSIHKRGAFRGAAVRAHEGRDEAFVVWFNDTAPGGKNPLPALTRAGIAHLYFVSIHPFEDGNGRIGRALAEKVARPKSRPTDADRARLHDRAQAQGLLRGAGAQQQGQRDHGLADYFANTILRSAKQHDQARRFLRRQGANSTRSFATSSMSVRTRSSPACSGRASTVSRAA